MDGNDLADRLKLAHAALQATADLVGVRLLHVKGYAMMAGLYPERRHSTDADVLVDPRGLEGFLGALEQHGWEIVAHFDSGSAFQHAMTLRHPWWGPADVHRHFPGMTADPTVVFDRLWERHELQPIAHLPCTVPGVPDQILFLLIHAGRDGTRGQRDVRHLRRILSPADLRDLRHRAQELGCELALAVALGEMEEYRDHPDYRLWKSVSEGGTRVEEWLGRLRAARTPAARLRTVRAMLTVNRDHLAMRLGHRPSREEVRQEATARRRQALRDLGGLLSSRGSRRAGTGPTEEDAR